MFKATVRKASVFTLLALALVAFFSLAAEASTISITNRCGDDIYYLYISSSGASSWEEDVLGYDILENGKTLRVNVIGSYNQFDLRAEDDEGNYLEWYQFPGNTSQITLNGDGTASYQ